MIDSIFFKLQASSSRPVNSAVSRNTSRIAMTAVKYTYHKEVRGFQLSSSTKLRIVELGLRYAL
jgi:hypothetical protein